MKRIALFALVLAGCIEPPSYYVANVYSTPNGTMVQRCELGSQANGPNPSACHIEPMQNAPYGFTDSEPRPQPTATPPTQADLVKLFNSTDVHRDVEACKEQYANAVTSFRVKITVAPTGDVTQVVPTETANVDEWFTQCAVKAVTAFKLTPFVGGADSQITTDVVFSL
jgi:hypothetical protein